MAALINQYDNLKRENPFLKTEELADLLENFKNYCHKKIKEFFISKDEMESLKKDLYKDFKSIKRHRIIINYESYADKYPWIGKGESDESFAEIINQMATVEAMIWVLRLEENKGWNVILAHPTQTSSRKKEFNNDLVIEHPQSKVIRVYEISDTVSNRRDGNRKFAQDVKSLGKLAPKGVETYIVCSSELWDLNKNKEIKHHQRNYIAVKKYYSEDPSIALLKIEY